MGINCSFNQEVRSENPAWYVPVVVAEAGCGREDVPGREDGADAPGPVHPPVPVQ